MKKTIPTVLVAASTTTDATENLAASLGHSFQIVDDNLFGICFDDIKSAINLSSLEDRAEGFYLNFFEALLTSKRPIRNEAFFTVIEANTVIATSVAQSKLLQLIDKNVNPAVISSSLHGYAALLAVAASDANYTELFTKLIDYLKNPAFPISTTAPIFSVLDALDPKLVRSIINSQFVTLRDIRRHLYVATKIDQPNTEETPSLNPENQSSDSPKSTRPQKAKKSKLTSIIETQDAPATSGNHAEAVNA